MKVELKKQYPSVTAALPDRKLFMTQGKTYSVSPHEWPLLRKYCLFVKTGPLQIIKKSTLKVYVIDGIGDIHWVFMKLGGLKRACGARRVNLYIRDIAPARPYRAMQFVEMNPIIHHAEYTKQMLDVPPDGFLVDHEGYDYVLSANGILESGDKLENWLPDIPLDYDYPLNIRTPKISDAAFVYFGAKDVEEPWAGSWTSADWARVVSAISRKTRVVALGLDCDRGKAVEVASADADFKDLLGQTTFEQALALALGGKVLFGSVSGLTMVAASKGARTVVLWPDSKSKRPLPVEMRTSWIDVKNRPNYKPIGYSATVRDAQLAIQSAWRGK